MTPSAWSVALGLVGTLLAAAPVAAQPKELPLEVSTISGPSETMARGGVWKPAKLRDKVAEGMGARALSGARMSLRTASGNSIRLAPLSQIFVAEPAAGAPAGAPQLVTLDGGRMWVSVLPLTVTRAPLEIEAGPVTVAARSGGVAVRANQDGTVIVRVYHGLAVARATKGTAWERPLKAGEQLLVPAAGAPGAPGPIIADPEETSWVKWNSDQDISAYGMPSGK